MKKKCLVGLLVLIALCLAGIIPSPAFAGTDVSGMISTNTTWSASASPYTVTGGILVKSGATLTIQPGVTIKIGAGLSFQIEGALVARGTSSSKITFTCNVTDPKPENWGYILFKDSSVDADTGTSGSYVAGSIMEHCVVEYAGASSNYALRAGRGTPVY